MEKLKKIKKSIINNYENQKIQQNYKKSIEKRRALIRKQKE